MMTVPAMEMARVEQTNIGKYLWDQVLENPRDLSLVEELLRQGCMLERGWGLLLEWTRAR